MVGAPLTSKRSSARRRWRLVLGGLITALALAVIMFGRGPPQPGKVTTGPLLRAVLLTRFKPSPSPVRGLAFAPDGGVVIAYADGALMRRTKAGAIRRLRRGSPVASMRMSPNKHSLALGGYDGSVVLVDLEGRALRTLAAKGAATWSLTFSKNGKQLAAGSEDGRLRLFDLPSGAGRVVRAHSLNIWSLDANRDGILASGSFDRRIRLWDAVTGAPRPGNAAHDQAVVAMAFAPDGKSLASGGDDATLRLWDDRLRPKWRQPSGQHLFALSFTPDGSWIVSGGREASGLQALFRQLFGVRIGGGNGTTIRLWRAADGALVDAVGSQAGDVAALALSPDGSLVASGADDGSVAIWRLEPAAR
jgi:WD40 repeat protein